jgi:predicted Zn-dependent protease
MAGFRRDGRAECGGGEQAVSAVIQLRRAAGFGAALLAVACALVFAGAAGISAQETVAGDASGNAAKVNAAAAKAAASDPLLQAMREELERSKAHLKMENVPAPFYIDYRLTDTDEYNLEAAFGALRTSTHTHARYIRVVVRVGDYKLDSYIGPGTGTVNLAPLDNDAEALRWQIWQATDQAYKIASQALAAKRAMLSRYSSGQPFDDFAHATPVQAIEPVAKIEFDPRAWEQTVEKASALFRSDPKIEMLSSLARCWAVNQYFVNTEGTVTRQGYTGCFAVTSGSTQAADGMRLADDAPYRSATPEGLPSQEQVVADAGKMLETLKALREAPIVGDDYQGPVLFSPEAASEAFDALIGSNVLGRRPRPGDSARTVGPFASSYRTRVLPAFVSVTDDPTMAEFHGETLQGHYAVDDEGVPAQKVPVIVNGILTNYLMDREPIQDFPQSNGHGRAGPGQPPAPNVGVLEVESKEPLSAADMKKKLIEICRQDNLPYGYYLAETAGVRNLTPRLLYRVYVEDGRKELVRGAALNELDTRALRNGLVALGNDPGVSNREGTVARTIISPSMLVDDVEVKRTDQTNAKLPEYPPPDLSRSN